VSAFLALFRIAVPPLVSAFEPFRRVIGTPAESREAERLYAVLPDVNFSERVLSASVERLATIRVKSVEWSDLGNVERVMHSLGRAGRRPGWFRHVEVA
jgi:hypothetical protein